MRFRHIVSALRGAQILGNARPSPLGRETRSRLFVPTGGALNFEQPDLKHNLPSLSVFDEEGEEQVFTTPGWPEEHFEYPSPRAPTPQLPEARPEDRHPADYRRGGADRPESPRLGGSTQFTADDDTMLRTLNVTSPSTANLARVMNALLFDLGQRRRITRLES